MSNRRFVSLALVAFGVTMPARALAAQDAEAGKVLYDKWCAGCHGDSGAGDGEAAAFMLPQPRDFTGAVYQVRTTASGELPTDDDLRRVIDNGMPGSTMPGWSSKLSPGQRDDVIAYLKTFSRFFEGASPQPIEVGRKPGSPSDEELAEGRLLFEDELQCLRCHGNMGRGDGPSAPELMDDWGFPIRAADLTEPWNFNGGGSVEDVYMRMRTGLDGTPMPSNSDVVDAGIVTDEQLWRVAQYVRSLAPSEDVPERRDVIRAALVEAGSLPASPDDVAWDASEPYYIPLVGQITLKPRWFVPMVDGVWVRAAHDGQELTLRVSWADPTRSPDSEWEPFFQGVLNTLAAPDGPHLTEQGPDYLTVQFPVERPEGTELPYFLGGEPRRPVYLVRWHSTPDGVSEGTATGKGSFTALAGTEVRHASSHEDGQWQLQFTRGLIPGDTTVAPVLVAGEPYPIAFAASDGTNGEDVVRGSVSAWYSIYLDVPTPTRVYVAPVVTALLTAGLGLVIVFRAQHRARNG